MTAAPSVTPPRVTACMIIGAAPEPFLASTLRGLEGAVDRLVVNVNGDNSENRRALLESAMHRQGRLISIESAFETFSAARNLCLAQVDTPWLLNVDADEVHGPGLRVLTREVLPILPLNVARLSITLVHFMQSLTHFRRIDTKVNVLIRRTPKLRWVGDVHETVEGLVGETWPTPYACGHYSYCRKPVDILTKWELYYRLGDLIYADILSRPPPTANLLDPEVASSLPYHGRHPPSLEPLPAEISVGRGPDSRWIDHLISWRLQRKVRSRWWPRLLDLGPAGWAPMRSLWSELDERLGRWLPF